MSTLTQLAEWQALQQHYVNIKPQHMRDMFAHDPQRFQRFSLNACGLLLDYSKNRIAADTLPLLCDLANACCLPEKIKAMFQGETINTTEQRPALHIALRASASGSIYLNAENIVAKVQAELAIMRDMCDKLRSKRWLSAHGKPITDIVNIGIGGSDLGPAMVTEALSAYHDTALRVHFVSNIDANHMLDVLKDLDPATTLFIIASKSFTTLETITNAKTACAWLNHPEAIAQQVIAITANPAKALEFGVAENHILKLWHWVGGRYSLWSAIGLPIALSIGMDNFEQLLAGAHAMDQHFLTAPLAKNMPVILALLGIWYINFFAANSYAVLPYNQRLKRLPALLKQLDMESNGKSMRLDNVAVDYATGPNICGEVGANGQHAFHQMFHQGTSLIPLDFIIALNAEHGFIEHQHILYANCLSQSQALMRGKSFTETFDHLIAAGLDESTAKHLAQQKQIPGNKPSNTIIMEALTPNSLGTLLALYEHKIFTQGVIWGINSFDQFGIELGKDLAATILQQIHSNKLDAEHDSSTAALLQLYLNS